MMAAAPPPDMMIRSAEKEEKEKEETEKEREAGRQSLDRNPFHKNRTIAKISWPPSRRPTEERRTDGRTMGWRG